MNNSKEEICNLTEDTTYDSIPDNADIENNTDELCVMESAGFNPDSMLLNIPLFKKMINYDTEIFNLRMPKRTKKEASGKFFPKLSFYLGLGLVLAGLINAFIGQRVVVEGCSMYPSYNEGENLFVEKISYNIDSPQRFDVIVFLHEERYLIKRVVGLPGETVKIDSTGTIYINGHILEEPYTFDTIEFPGLFENEITLSTNEYFVLGDNRNNSYDSRHIGPVTYEQLLGKIVE